MPTVHNLHQPLFGYRPCTASHSLRRHNQRTDRLDSDLLLVPLASDSLIEVSLDPLAPRLANAYTIGARRARPVRASRPLNESVNINYYYNISNGSSSFKNQKLNLCSQSGSTSTSTPNVSFALHSLGQGALLHRARVTSHTPLALSARVQAAQCVSTQTFNRLRVPSHRRLEVRALGALNPWESATGHTRGHRQWWGCSSLVAT